jgi:hypothetical protein
MNYSSKHAQYLRRTVGTRAAAAYLRSYGVSIELAFYILFGN